MRNFNINQTLVNRDAVLSTIWSTIQQMVVAASTYFIIRAIGEVTAGAINHGLFYAGLFVVSLILVYIPNTISVLYLQRWRISSMKSFVEAFVERNKGKAPFGHERKKCHAESWLTNESFSIYDTATNLIYQIYSTALNSIFNIFAIAFALDPRLLAWYLAAGAILVGVNLVFKGAINDVALESQKARQDLSSAMLRAWDNIFTVNRYSLSNWQSIFRSKIRDAKTSATRYDLIRSVISSLAVCLALIVVSFGNGVFLSQSLGDIPKLSALLITFSRQLQIIQSIFAFFNLVLSWMGVRSQLKELERVVQLSATPTESEKYIRFGEISVLNGDQDQRFSGTSDFSDRILEAKSGRWTLRGPNGSGKSTLLATLKESCGERAFLLPSRFGDLCFLREFRSGSDGQRMLSVFSEIASLDDVTVVILDEWDANLDGHNLSLIDREIDGLAKSKVILEVRHRE